MTIRINYNRNTALERSVMGGGLKALALDSAVVTKGIRSKLLFCASRRHLTSPYLEEVKASGFF